MNKLKLIDKNPEKKNDPVGLYRSSRDKLNKVMLHMGETNVTKVASMLIDYAYENIEWVSEEAAE